jgi:hypothetical protein
VHCWMMILEEQHKVQGSRFIRALLDDDTERTAQGSRFKFHTCFVG